MWVGVFEVDEDNISAIRTPGGAEAEGRQPKQPKPKYNETKNDTDSTQPRNIACGARKRRSRTTGGEHERDPPGSGANPGSIRGDAGRPDRSDRAGKG